MTVNEIKSAIEHLSKSEVSELSNWFEKIEAEIWDERIAIDSASGRFDHLISEEMPRKSI